MPEFAELGELWTLKADDPRLLEIVATLRANGFERAITNSAVSGGFVSQLKEAGFEVVSLIHELPRIVDEYDLDDALEAIFAGSDKIVFPSAAVAATTGAAGPQEKIVVRPQGLYASMEAPPDARERVRRELGIPADGRIVLNVGWGDLRKGVDIFIRAAQLAATSDRTLHFVWVGGLHPEVERWLQPDVRPEVERIHFLPRTTDVARYYAAADVLFLSSREDPFPSVVLEALRAGLPVVGLKGSGGS